MLNSKFLLVGSLATGLLLAMPLKGESRLAANGVSLNGVSINGASLNTNRITPAPTDGVLRVEGGQLVIESGSMSR